MDAVGTEPRFVLITQCLQNDFFLNLDCRLRLPDTIVPQMLLGPSDFDLNAGGNRPNARRAKEIADGPLGIFLDATVGRRLRTRDERKVLHLINIRDWHVPGNAYDVERRAYGSHCEQGSWGARYLEGAERWLDPTGTGETDEYAEAGAVRLYHIRSDSLFDFKPRVEGDPDDRRTVRASPLEDILDIVVQGTDDEIDHMRGLLLNGGLGAIHEVAREIDSEERPQTTKAYVAVIGVWTDIKIQTLLVGLRTQYDLQNLAVSDTFTASLTLERHLAGLDYAAKVLDAEVVHGINDLAGFLGFAPALESEAGIVSRQAYARYKSFFQDKQNVLAFQDEKLRQYLELTERRSIDVYERIKRTNTFLIVFGCAFLTVTLVMAVLNAIDPDQFRWEIAAVTGGVGLLQLVSAFVSKPIRDLQQNLTNLAVFKMILESHSLKTALARFHLTTPRTLRELQGPEEAELAEKQVAILHQQVSAIQQFDSADFADLAKLALAVGDGGRAADAAVAAAVADGGGSAPGKDPQPPSTGRRGSDGRSSAR